MGSFKSTLREEVDASRDQLVLAVRRDEAADVHRHGARLADLLERARRHAIDTSGWVDPHLLSIARDAV